MITETTLAGILGFSLGMGIASGMMWFLVLHFWKPQ